MVRTTLIAALCCVGGLPIFAANMAMSDTNFVRKAAEANYAEIQMGKLAQEKGTNQAVKDFGQRMVTDHGKSYDQLKPIASKESVTMPDKMNVKDQALYDRLSRLSGTQFDREYVRAMVKDHQSDVADFQRESGRAKDQDVRAYASNTLPVLQEHLRLAEDANRKVGASASK